MRNNFTLWLLGWVINRVHRDRYKGPYNYDLEVAALCNLKDAKETLALRHN